MKKEIRTDKAPLPIGPYSQAVRVSNLVFIAGQLGIDPETDKLLEGIETQTKKVMENLKAILEEAGATMDDVVRCDIHLASLADFPRVNEIYASYFTAPYPARLTVQSAGLPKGALVEIAAIATI
ncbi:RidA family protein [bacterium]|nr:RidA family protein [bacterium]